MNLYSIGEMVIDFIPGSEKRSYIANAGGAPANVAIAVSRNGFESGLCCSVGEDDFGHFLMKTLENDHVRILNPQLCSEAITTMAFVSLDENHDRSFTFARKPGADMFLAPEAVKEEDIAEVSVIHAGSCSLSAPPAAEATRKALRLGHEKGKLVSFDVNYRNVMWKDDLDGCIRAVFDILPYVDLLKISDEEAGMLGGEEAIAKVMEENRITAVIETLGAKGARAYFGSECFETAGHKIQVADTTGAGDAFWGGFLSYLLMQGIENAGQLDAGLIRRAMRYGNMAGTICCRHMGAIESLPTRKEIEEALEREEER